MNDLFNLLEDFSLFYSLYGVYKHHNQRYPRRRRWWVRPLNINRDSLGYFETTFKKMKEIDEEEFFIHTRMTKPIYEVLLKMIEPEITKTSIRRAIDPECRLAITLSYLSQGVSPQFLAWNYKVGKSTTRRIILETCEALWTVLSNTYVSEPTESNYSNITEEFAAKWNMPNCVGAIDGKHINIQCPPNSGSSFFNYKKTFSIVLLASCNANYVFQHICVGAYGSQSDGGILQQSSFGKKLLNEQLPLPKESILPHSAHIFPHYFVADAAFPLRKNIMRPFPGKCLNRPKEIFNYRLSRARRVIENAFGILVARWRILKQTMNLLPENVEKIVLATVALHNFIKSHDDSEKYCPPKFADWEDEHNTVQLGEWRNEVGALENLNRVGSNNASRNAFTLRETLMEYFMNEGAVSFQ